MAYLVKMGTDADEIPACCAECWCCHGSGVVTTRCYCAAEGVRFLIDIDGHEINPAKEKPSWCRIQGPAETVFKCICSTQYWQYNPDHYECQNCGKKFETGSKFCPECGAKVIAIEEYEED